ncbi:lectin-like domain-containing protein [Companilactobacillus zhongbaensis]|uniref:lectin-like domain-containing protein n=1 Tax=Companilactobacillus zhongbaensis TaxID=2486009 RepID=UPI000F773EB5|nr:hypothetical protein [Companilactobacillus zhongbaensis]
MNKQLLLKLTLIYFVALLIIILILFKIDVGSKDVSQAALQKNDPIIVQKDFQSNGQISNYSLIDDILGPESRYIPGALRNAPEGLDIASLFEFGIFGDSLKEIKNTVEIVPSETGHSPESSILKVTDGPDQLGAIWSKVSAGNYIDVSKDQTLSMWLHFGYNGALNGSGDGMAFVLQNDNDGIKAIAAENKHSDHPKFGEGESLGVWGTDFKSSETNAANIAATAIQNSFAIEFDTYADKQDNGDHVLETRGASFDLPIYNAAPQNNSYQHIAMGYPSSSNTYNLKRDYRGNYFTMNHMLPIKNLYMTDGRWHHVTINWQHIDDKTARLTYQFNDKKIDGTPNRNPTNELPIESVYNYVMSYAYLTESTTIDISRFHLPKEGPNANKLRWGFTGSTGNHEQINLISFETVPSVVNAEISASIYDETRKFEISDKLQNQANKVFVGDDLTFQYHLEYMSGQENWVNIFSKADMPAGVKFVSADITYADGTTEEVTDPQITNNVLTCKITRPLNNLMKSATLNIHAQAGSEVMTVKSAHARFKSQFDITDVQVPSFEIVSDELNLRTDPFGTINFANKSVMKSPFEINCYVWKKDLYQTNASNVKLLYKIKNSESTEVTESIADLQKLSRTTPNILEIPKDKFKFGMNQIEIYAKDYTNGNKTATHVIIVNVGGDLLFENNTPHVFFRTQFADFPGKIIPRMGKWDFQVSDARSKSNGWRLAVSAMPDPKEKTHFNGKVIYKKSGGKELSLDSMQVIDSDKKDDDSIKETNIVKPWKSDDGILLKSKGQNNPGKYSFILSWFLIDGI